MRFSISLGASSKWWVSKGWHKAGSVPRTLKIIGHYHAKFICLGIVASWCCVVVLLQILGRLLFFPSLCWRCYVTVMIISATSFVVSTGRFIGTRWRLKMSELNLRLFLWHIILLFLCFVSLVIHLQGPSKEDVLKKVESLMEEYLRSGNVQDALSSYREQKIPDRFVRHVLLAIMTHTLDKSGKYLQWTAFLKRALLRLLTIQSRSTEDSFGYVRCVALQVFVFSLLTAQWQHL